MLGQVGSRGVNGVLWAGNQSLHLDTTIVIGQAAAFPFPGDSFSLCL